MEVIYAQWLLLNYCVYLAEMLVWKNFQFQWELYIANVISSTFLIAVSYSLN